MASEIASREDPTWSWIPGDRSTMTSTMSTMISTRPNTLQNTIYVIKNIRDIENNMDVYKVWCGSAFYKMSILITIILSQRKCRGNGKQDINY